MFSQLFGRYLVDQEVITDDELRGMIQRQGDERLKLGTIAVAQGLMTEQQVAEVNHLQVQMDKRFGDIAVERGYLSGSDVGNLLSKQGNICMKFLQILSEQKKISLEDCNRLVSQFQKYYGFSDDELEALKQNDFDEIAPAFVYASKPYVTELSALVMRNKKILIIEDDKDLQEELSCLLERNGYATECVTDFRNTWESMRETDADLILLDLTLPDTDGQTLLRRFRKESLLPVIIMTSKNTEMDEVLCMTYGADDFIAKPYNPMILLLHMEAVFRRASRENETILQYKELQLDLDRGSMQAGSGKTDLTKNESRILAYLIRNQGKIVSRDELIRYLWESDEFVDDNTLTVNITRIRKKLEECGMEELIKTKRGQGYILG